MPKVRVIAQAQEAPISPLELVHTLKDELLKLQNQVLTPKVNILKLQEQELMQKVRVLKHYLLLPQEMVLMPKAMEQKLLVIILIVKANLLLLEEIIHTQKDIALLQMEKMLTQKASLPIKLI
jgi:hypothetical protein